MAKAKKKSSKNFWSKRQKFGGAAGTLATPLQMLMMIAENSD